MFGTYRTLLAIWVVVDHNFGLGVTSAPAVAGFFCLSGFLMTHLVSVPYRGRVGAFFLNRFLRIYPLYWFALFGLVWYIGASIVWTWPFIKQALLINRPGEGLYILPSWAVTTELVFYLLIGFPGISKTLNRTLIWFAASCAASIAVVIYEYASGTNDFMGPLYFSIWSGSLPFSFGALLYHLSARWVLPATPSLLIGGAVIAASALLASVGLHLWGRNDLLIFGVYGAIAGQAPVLLALFKLKVSDGRKTVDEWIGRFSYPLYLLHMVMYGIAADRHLIQPGMNVHNGLVVLGISVAVAAVAMIVIDVPIQMVRNFIRGVSRRPAAITVVA